MCLQFSEEVDEEAKLAIAKSIQKKKYVLMEWIDG